MTRSSRSLEVTAGTQTAGLSSDDPEPKKAANPWASLFPSLGSQAVLAAHAQLRAEPTEAAGAQQLCIDASSRWRSPLGAGRGVPSVRPGREPKPEPEPEPEPRRLQLPLRAAAPRSSTARTQAQPEPAVSLPTRPLPPAPQP